MKKAITAISAALILLGSPCGAGQADAHGSYARRVDRSLQHNSSDSNSNRNGSSNSSSNSPGLDNINELSRASLVTLLNPYLQPSVDAYYASIDEPPRQYGLYDAEILELRRTTDGGYRFYARIALTTFTGPHNPPYGKETVSLYFDTASAQVIDYSHREIPYTNGSPPI
jgi:hypothetical protein